MAPDSDHIPSIIYDGALEPMKLTMKMAPVESSASELHFNYPEPFDDGLASKAVIKTTWGTKKTTLRVITGNADTHSFCLARTLEGRMLKQLKKSPSYFCFWSSDMDIAIMHVLWEFGSMKFRALW